MKQYVVTTKRLYKRKYPVTDLADKTNIAGTVENGFTFLGEEATDLANSLGKWYKDRDGYYYWGGGLVEKTDPPANPGIPAQEPLITYDPQKMSWGHKFLDLPFIWNEIRSKGKNITIAVIDTGIDFAHPDLSASLHPQSRSFVKNSVPFVDNDGHGTNMAGIIGATGKQLVYGVAPACKLLILKATEKPKVTDLSAFASALDFAAALPEVDIISVSYAFPDNPMIRASISNCIRANKFVFAAIGNERDLDLGDAPDPDNFPACYDGVIAIGAFDATGSVCDFSNRNPHLTFVAPGDFEIITTGLSNKVVKAGGTSIATAFAAGCFGLGLSYSRLNGIADRDFLKAVTESCDHPGPGLARDIQSGYGRMNIKNALLKLRSS